MTSTARLAPVAFPLGFIPLLPTVQELVKNVRPCKKTDDASAEADDFILVDAASRSGSVTPVPELSAMSIDDTPRKSPFVDMLVQEAAVGRTENSAVTYKTSLNALVDLFYAVKDNSASATILQHLGAAWDADPLKTLKLVFFLRDVRDGKGCSEEFYIAVSWLFKHHPETFKYNVVKFCPRFGYWKDLLQLLVRELLGEQGMKEHRAEAERNKTIFAPGPRNTRLRSASSVFRRHRRHRLGLDKPSEKTSGFQDKKARSKARRAKYAEMTPEEVAKTKAEFAMEVEEKQQECKLKAKKERHEKRASLIDQSRKAWSTRKDWQDLHIAIAKQFAVALHIDKMRLDAKKKVSSLCAKWAPTPDHYHDKYTCIAATIALILFPPAQHRRENESEETYISRALKMYQVQYLTPLREAAEVTETFMSARKWGSINYSHVPSLSFKRNKPAFESHDKERFTTHVLEAAAGKDGKKIQASTLKPNEIVRGFLNYGWRRNAEHDNDLDGQVLEAQWLNYVEGIKKAGALDNCIAIADVSGSMQGIPMECSIALSLLVATVARPPFNKAFITFSAQPQLVILPNSAQTLRDKVDFIQHMDWGMNTDFQAVFDLLLDRAKKHHLKNEDMVKTVFVFSDMQFDEACNSPLETDYQQIVRKFNKAGYDVPKIVFWNLRDSSHDGTPVLYDTIGTAMVSGWSGQMLKLFMEKGGEMINSPEFSPEYIMNAAIGKSNYDMLMVVD